MTISSRTPEGDPNRCSVCGHDLKIEPSTPPGDATCPDCGSLVWYPGVKGRLIPEYGEPIELIKDEIRMGRRATCDICLPSLRVSALHSILTYGDGRWSIKDCGSTNGIKVNDKRVALAVLEPGDKITIAGMNYRLEYDWPTQETMKTA